MHSFVAIDFETANRYRQSACEWGLAVWKDGEGVSSGATLLKPPTPYEYFEDYNVGLHGITPEMCADAESFAATLERLEESLRRVPVVAHNTGFDISVIRRTCEHLGIPYPELTYYCTYQLAKRSFGDDASVVDFRLKTLIPRIGIEWTQDHRAEGDAIAAGQLAKYLLDKHEAASLEELAEMLGMRAGRMGGAADQRFGSQSKKSKPPTAEELARRAEALKQFVGIDEWDPSGDFNGKRVKFTGSFARVKADYEAALTECGGIRQSTVNSKTDFVVEGTQALAQDKAGGSRAQKAAMEQKAAGADIEVIDEREFLDLLSS